MSAKYCPLCWAEGLSAALPYLLSEDRARLIREALSRLSPVIGTTPGFRAASQWALQLNLAESHAARGLPTDISPGDAAEGLWRAWVHSILPLLKRHHREVRDDD